MKEQAPRGEFSGAEQSLIAQLRERGSDDPETHELLLRWCRSEEAKVTEVNTSRAGIELDIKKARLYSAAGYPEEAWASLEAARQAAYNEDDEGLFKQAERLMDQMGAE